MISEKYQSMIDWNPAKRRRRRRARRKIKRENRSTFREKRIWLRSKKRKKSRPMKFNKMQVDARRILLKRKNKNKNKRKKKIMKTRSKNSPIILGIKNNENS